MSELKSLRHYSSVLNENFLTLGCSILTLLQTDNPSYVATSYRCHENLKKRTYEQRIREVEHGSFTPLVLSATGGLGRAATVSYRRLASLLSTKWDQPHSTTMGWLRCRLSFSLLRSSILCIRGARSSSGHAAKSVFLPVDLVTSESQVTLLHYLSIWPHL